MLSAFTARPIVELKQRDKSKIQSLLAYGDRLIAGLNTGVLRIYRVNELDEASSSNGNTGAPNGTAASDDRQASQPKMRPVDLLREVEKFSRRSIEQLAVIKEANILVSLSDNYVSIYDLQTYALQEQLAITKGASSFAVTSNTAEDPETGVQSMVSRLVVAVKRKILLWTWEDAELSSETLEISLTGTPRSLTWVSGIKLIAGMNSGYVLVNIESKATSDIYSRGSAMGAAAPQGSKFSDVASSGMGYIGMGSWIPKPLSTKLAEEVLLARDINTLFIDLSGSALDKRQIPWSTAPEAIGYSYPYLLALQPSSQGTLEVRNPDTLSLLQTIPLQNANQLHVPQPNVSLPHAGKGFLVCSDRCIWRMGSVDYDSQVDELVENDRLDEAISLLGMIEDALLKDKEGRLREIKMQKAQTLFHMRRYRESLDLFTEVSAPPERVIRLYPHVVSGDLQDTSEEEVEGEFKNGAIKAEGDELSHPSAVDKIKAQQKTKGSDSASIVSSIRGDAANSSDTGSINGKHSELIAEDKPLEGKDLQSAVLELCTFLVDTRTKLQRYLTFDGTLKSTTENGQTRAPYGYLLTAPAADTSDDLARQLHDTAKLVDSTLFRCYMLARPALAASLFRIPNFCEPNVANEKLLEKKRYNDLVDFFNGKKLHRSALELLKKFGQAEDEDESIATLRGPRRTVGYLQTLPPELIDIILEFAEWPIKDDSELGMEIFLADTENAETLPRDRVLDFLEQIEIGLAVKYLEHVIDELNDLSPDFHQRLVRLYLERLKGHGQDASSQGDSPKSDEWIVWKEKLLAFLESSQQYSTSKAFSLIPKDDPEFYEARAIVLSKMGQYRQALEIYIFKMENNLKAEELCNRVYLTEESSPSMQEKTRLAAAGEQEDEKHSIYHTLLALYLNPPSPNQPKWEPALDLLSKHGSRLPASSTLNLIPGSLPVQKLESYFRGRMRAAASLLNEERVVAGLRKTEVVSAQASLLLGENPAHSHGGRNRKVVIEEDRLCGVCHKRLGRSVINVFPDNTVVHYGCSSRR